jgi:hypothetical protein
MSRRQKDPLRALSGEERAELMRLSHSQSTPAAQVARTTALLAVADGQSYLAAARQVQPALRTLKATVGTTAATVTAIIIRPMTLPSVSRSK